ncbi:MAG: sulfurtransferase TusA family protein [Rhodobacter sp.]|uniref:sulfurtransferase TusA family protein n=1 Tax=Pararhodobacter sp. TaxID=2127056 RepID=UPI001D787598|nr:sulfurtransferase TusA family protein [Pararhodobacter sp.]MCB1344886.1 sulfurtransferase TusA family protein [Paracoccaceae bacterium]MCC0072077.1 sulfurtransferase TusA family protein [Rhodobacter sp.]HPD93850.1 sulfurtransferase TusA family protein [Pararhodobacter sp.]
MEHDDEIDARGLLCPLPVLKARKRLVGMAPGAVLLVRASDVASIVDMPHFCVQTGHAYLGLTETPDGLEHRIRRGANPPPRA